MDSGLLFILFVVGGGIIGGSIGAIMWTIKSKNIMTKYKLAKSMKLAEVVALIGEPITKTPKANKIICSWNLELNNKPIVVKAVFENDVLKSIG